MISFLVIMMAFEYFGPCLEFDGKCRMYVNVDDENVISSCLLLRQGETSRDGED